MNKSISQIIFRSCFLLLLASQGYLCSVVVKAATENDEASRSALEQSATEAKIDLLVNKVMTEFQVPGIAIGVIQGGKTIHLKGYGIANIESKTDVNQDTLFKIASNSKAFTAAALAILVDREKLNWHDKVVSYLPNFKMYDAWVTKEFNIRDLLTHRSGLRIGAGDLMLWPEPTLFTRQDVIENLRFLKPVASFRDKYAYDNLLYIVAGEIVAKISGMSWEDFIHSQIFTPLKMENCLAGGIDPAIHTNIIAPHGVISGELTMLAENQMSRQTSLMAAAGGIKCSASDLLKWVSTQLNHGKMEHGAELFSELQASEMWKPVTTLPMSTSSRLLDKATHRSYALGWRISDYYGHLQVSHTGTLSGSMSKVILLPDQQIGIVILTNQQSSYARNALARGLLSELVGVNVKDVNNENKDRDWVAFYKEQQEEKLKNELTTVPQEKKNRTEKHIADNDAQNYLLGIYQDPWFGKVTLSRVEDAIIFAAEKSPRIKGKLYAHAKNQWWVKWDDRSHEADAWLFFEVLNPGPTSNPFDIEDQIILKMKAIADDADWSFDFEDLYFTKLE